MSVQRVRRGLHLLCGFVFGISRWRSLGRGEFEVLLELAATARHQSATQKLPPGADEPALNGISEASVVGLGFRCPEAEPGVPRRVPPHHQLH